MRMVKTIPVAFMGAIVLFLGSWRFASTQEIDDRPAFRVHLRMDRYSFDDDGAVKLNVCVTNNKFRQEHFKIFDMDYITFQPVVYTSSGREADILVPHRLKKEKNGDILKKLAPRVMALSRNETMVHTIDLRKIYNLQEPGEYRVRAYFIPDPGNPFAVPSENILRFKIARPDVFASGSLYGPVRERAGDPSKFSISPREVVLLFLTAEKEKSWQNYLKYVKLDSYINSFPDFGRIYNVSDDVEKLKIEDEFITFLKSRRHDYIIDFRVGGEFFVEGKRVAYVDSRVKRHGSPYRMDYDYRYTLEKFDSLWLITGIEASVKKGN